ncbi:hypothetical protein FVE85_9817 [Porphyridium purpureum]|uniref:Uncharacterized protein n=1 Tax=Porphyridium purpureum TaxID=35688 RepID=A0A5J4YIE5_PORPP|nr:hypothetical protein FVE85_7861 [Porphyridium purpureum]KAA8490925.1 hypothetical protein FVE85_9817 [Porphyridium purpureum]|eukprot:POR7044..scf271_22
MRKIKNDLLSPEHPKKAYRLCHAWIDKQSHNVLHSKEASEGQQYLPQHAEFAVGLPSAHAVHDEGRRGSGCEREQRVFLAEPNQPDASPSRNGVAGQPLFLCVLGKRGDCTRKGSLVQYKANIWGFFFKIDTKCFHLRDVIHAHTFDHQIEIDRVRCSILLKWRGMVEKSVKELKPEKGSGETYIDKAEEDTPLTDTQVVAVDANQSDPLYGVANDTRSKPIFTQNTRRKETKTNLPQLQATQAKGGGW